MKGIRIAEYVKGPRDLTVSSIPDPAPGPDEYLIEVHAAATNFFDILQIQGKYQNQPPFPWTAGSEFAGVVLSTPKTTTSPKFPVGSRVFGAAQGAYATRLSCPESSLLPVPKGWSFAQAAGLFVTAPTAYAALTLRANVQAGETVLVHAAAGGVGLAAVQVAKALGATVIATASTEHKRAVARSFGADHAVSYADPKSWPAAVRDLTPGKRGVDVVFDPVGAVDLSTKCAAWNARIVIVGFAAGKIEKVAMNKVLLKNISLVGVHWGAYGKNEPGAIPGVWRGIMELVEAGKYRGTEFTDREFVGLDSVSEALVALGGRETWGKVVVKVPQEGGSKL